jgi:hypothetical protein
VGLGSGWIKIKGRERTFIFHLKANNGEKEKNRRESRPPSADIFLQAGQEKATLYIYFYVLVLQIKGKTN